MKYLIQVIFILSTISCSAQVLEIFDELSWTEDEDQIVELTQDNNFQIRGDEGDFEYTKSHSGIEYIYKFKFKDYKLSLIELYVSKGDSWKKSINSYCTVSNLGSDCLKKASESMHRQYPIGWGWNIYSKILSEFAGSIYESKLNYFTFEINKYLFHDDIGSVINEIIISRPNYNEEFHFFKKINVVLLNNNIQMDSFYHKDSQSGMIIYFEISPVNNDE